MTAIVQISDPHFGTERPAVVEALVRFVSDLAPELVVLSGDITQRATRAQFAAARRFADRLRSPALLAIAGNHDVPLFNLAARLLSPYANYRRAFGDELEPEHRSPGWLVLGVKTTRRWRHTNGALSTEQIDRVVARLAAADPSQMRVVVVHQPVAVRDDADAHDLLRGHEAAVRRWAEAGADVIVGGHIHLPYIVPLHRRHAGLARRLWCVQAGTSVSSRVRDGVGNSVNVLLQEGIAAPGRPQCVAERWDFDVRSGRFERVGSERLDLSAVVVAR
ncbi:MAG: metallophosphoesterase [Burkholderiaceae bacterium]